MPISKASNSYFNDSIKISTSLQKELPKQPKNDQKSIKFLHKIHSASKKNFHGGFNQKFSKAFLIFLPTFPFLPDPKNHPISKASNSPMQPNSEQRGILTRRNFQISYKFYYNLITFKQEIRPKTDFTSQNQIKVQTQTKPRPIIKDFTAQ